MGRKSRCRRCLVPTIAIVSLLVIPPAALAARPPTIKEREAITNALPASVRKIPIECLWLDVRISTRDARYAFVGGVYLNASPRGRCLRYAGNGFQIFKKTSGKWRVVYSGSDWPTCRLGIPRDLIPCTR
jgi:hypothetical protein